MPSPRSRSARYRRLAAQAEAYRTHALVGLACSLVLVTGLFRLPWDASGPALGWGRYADDWLQAEVEPEVLPEAAAAEGRALYTVQVADRSDGTDAGEDAGDYVTEGAGGEGGEVASAREPVVPLDRLEAQPVLEFAERAPQLVGGLGALYLNIRYPQAAIDAGIQGRLLLEFIVEPDGRPTHIEVRQSLHPLCDSAAVRALRAVSFRPGYQNGEPVRVRFRLPVRFRIVAPGLDGMPDSTLTAAG